MRPAPRRSRRHPQCPIQHTRPSAAAPAQAYHRTRRSAAPAVSASAMPYGAHLAYPAPYNSHARCPPAPEYAPTPRPRRRPPSEHARPRTDDFLAPKSPEDDENHADFADSAQPHGGRWGYGRYGNAGRQSGLPGWSRRRGAQGQVPQGSGALRRDGRLRHHAGAARRQYVRLRLPDPEVSQADRQLHVPHGA